MFKFLLKLLGLEKYEYPHRDKPLQDVDITPEPTLQSSPEPEPEPEKAQAPKVSETKLTAEQMVEAFTDLKINYAKMLIDAGFDNVDKVKKATDKELLAIKGIGKATIKVLRS